MTIYLVLSVFTNATKTEANYTKNHVSYFPHFRERDGYNTG